MMGKIERIKWQIHAETSITQICMWIIFWKLFGGWVGYVAIFFILGNIGTLWKSVSKLGKDYYK